MLDGLRALLLTLAWLATLGTLLAAIALTLGPPIRAIARDVRTHHRAQQLHRRHRRSGRA